jgi:hypothetical protein
MGSAIRILAIQPRLTLFIPRRWWCRFVYYLPFSAAEDTRSAQI